MKNLDFRVEEEEERGRRGVFIQKYSYGAIIAGE
jgi:hypothetical protein